MVRLWRSAFWSIEDVVTLVGNAEGLSRSARLLWSRHNQTENHYPNASAGGRAEPAFTPTALHCALQKNLDGGRVLLSSSHVGLLEVIDGLLKGFLQGCLLGAIRGIRNRARTLAIAGVAEACIEARALRADQAIHDVMQMHLRRLHVLGAAGEPGMLCCRAHLLVHVRCGSGPYPDGKQPSACQGQRPQYRAPAPCTHDYPPLIAD